uniref:Uncharacterized protein n=1 Tax=viral metagenome TaxID=1070528 RepID=A0A6M3LMG7_9ZZZZ
MKPKLTILDLEHVKEMWLSGERMMSDQYIEKPLMPMIHVNYDRHETFIYHPDGKVDKY